MVAARLTTVTSNDSLSTQDLETSASPVESPRPGLLDSMPLARTGVPTYRRELIGRSSELARLQALLTGSERRLVSVLGPGGVGKTRLAIAAAERSASAFVDGVAFVPLASLSA